LKHTVGIYLKNLVYDMYEMLFVSSFNLFAKKLKRILFDIENH